MTFRRNASPEEEPGQRQQEENLVKTWLLLARLDRDSNSSTHGRSLSEEPSHLFLPAVDPASVTFGYDDVNVDEYLGCCIPQFHPLRSMLLSSSDSLDNGVAPIVRFASLDPQQPRLLYIGQREVGHAIASQADVIFSDRATTCHILIVRSTTTTTSQPLTSCAHLDGPFYESCLRKIFSRHYQHHTKHASHPRIYMELHVIGGFLDDKGRSRQLSNWLIYLLADLAADYAGRMSCTLVTCILTRFNSKEKSPLIRSLACDTASGRIFLARAQDFTVMGPDPILRQARLWSCRPSALQLTVVHTERHGDLFVIPPFELVSYVDIDHLLSLSDEELLLKSSSSPDCEEDDYCDSVRRALVLFSRFHTSQIFGLSGETARFYQRNPNFPNQWNLVGLQPRQLRYRYPPNGTHHQPKIVDATANPVIFQSSP